MQKNILITGGAGFIGYHIVRLFVTKYPDYKIINSDALSGVFSKHDITHVIHLAAESHVDRSILSPMDFIYTNIIGTVNLLNIAKELWKDNLQEHRFYHISTDEVFGTLGAQGLFTETTPYSPNSPYSASKASSDHFIRAYGETYG